MRSLVAFAAVLALTGCNGLDNLLPDGGKARMNCTNTPNEFPVKILDRAGDPAVGANVVATNAADGRNVKGVTDGSGVYKVSEILGPGTVKITGELGGYTTPEGNFTFTCGECDCACSPRELILKLQ